VRFNKPGSSGINKHYGYLAMIPTGGNWNTCRIQGFCWNSEAGQGITTAPIVANTVNCVRLDLVGLTSTSGPSGGNTADIWICPRTGLEKQFTIGSNRDRKTEFMHWVTSNQINRLAKNIPIGSGTPMKWFTDAVTPGILPKGISNQCEIVGDDYYKFSFEPAPDPCGSGYIGFKLPNTSGNTYGWVRLETRGNTTYVMDWAYDASGGTLDAGRTGGYPPICGPSCVTEDIGKSCGPPPVCQPWTPDCVTRKQRCCTNTNGGALLNCVNCADSGACSDSSQGCGTCGDPCTPLFIPNTDCNPVCIGSGAP
jgi:hypothetical protein